MTTPRWDWKPEKFRNINMPHQPVDAFNPAPLLVQAQSLEELTEIVKKFNSEHGYTDPKDYGLCIVSSGSVSPSAIAHHHLDEEIDWSKLQLVEISLPWGTYVDLIEIPNPKQP